MKKALWVSVGDTSVESVVVNGQIHLVLPLIEVGQTSVEFDFGDFSASLSLNILAAPTIADPPSYVSDVVTDVVAGLNALGEGDWQDDVDALMAVEQALSSLSEDEPSELAVLSEQNLEPLLQQLNSPDVAQFDAAACLQALGRFILSYEPLRIAIGIIAVYAIVPEPTKIVGIPIAAGTVVLAILSTLEKFGLAMDACLVTGIAALQASIEDLFQADSVMTTGVKLAQQAPELLSTIHKATQQESEALSTIHFDAGQAKAITIALAYRFEHESRAEILSAIRSLGDLLLKMNNGLRSVVDNLPGFLSGLVDGINSFIATFAQFENPDSVEVANHANFSLEGTSDPNITGSNTSADSARCGGRHSIKALFS